MSQPSFAARGAVDLSALASARPTSPDPASDHSTSAPAGGAPVGGTASAAPGGVEVVEVTELNLQRVVERSMQQAVFVLLCTRLAPGCADVRARIERVLGERAGMLLATVDVDEQPRVAQVFQVQAVPAMLAVISGQPVPLFQGAPDDDQLRSVVDQVMQVAAQAGLAGGAGADAGAAEPEPAPLPPLHQEAYDAIERGDYDGAIDAYDRALRENPKDAEAKAGRAQVALLRRTQDVDAPEARAAAAADAANVEAQLRVADLDVLGGAVEDAFARLLDTFVAVPVESREVIRQRLVDLFEVVGLTDARVITARKALAAALN